MPFKSNADRRRHIPKQRHRVTNWAEYDAGLRARGSLTVCTAPGSLDNSSSYAARLKVCSCQAARIASGLRWPFFSISHSAL